MHLFAAKTWWRLSNANAAPKRRSFLGIPLAKPWQAARLEAKNVNVNPPGDPHNQIGPALDRQTGGADRGCCGGPAACTVTHLDWAGSAAKIRHSILNQAEAGTR